MPESTRRQLRDERRAFLGEDKPTAEAAVGRHDLGVDRCSPAQRRFRALLALHLFNKDSTLANRDLHSAHSFLSYTMTVSPRYDHLLVITRHPENTLGRLLASPCLLTNGMPGLRVVAAWKSRAYYLVHLPTGARMVLADRSNFPSLEQIRQRNSRTRNVGTRNYLGPDVPLASEEQAVLDVLPSMTLEIETLLAALVSRLDARDPQRQWHMGLWWIIH